MNKPGVPSICIVGVGNTIRADDGIGSHISSAIEQMHVRDITTMTVQQLDAELVEDLLSFDHVLITDASINGKDADLYELFPDEITALSTSHHINAAMLAALAQKVYGKKLSLFLCAVRGYDFEIGEQLSDKAKANCTKAISLALEWIDLMRN